MLPFPVPTDQTFTRYLHLLAEEAESLEGELSSLCSDLDTEQFNWQPAAGSWSIGQCIRHLTIFNRQYFTSIDKSVEKARRKYVERALTRAAGLYKPGLLGGFLMRMMYPARLKVRTPQSFEPSHSDIPLSALRDFASAQRHMTHILRNAGDLDLNRVRVASPAAGLLRFRLGDILTILLLHERRHLEQMQRIINQEEFPV